jgi:signal recognition particle receptor subunit beta
MSVPYGHEEIRAKIVLCGPPLAGKASFLRRLGELLANAGEFRTSDLRTDDDRVLMLDAAPADLPHVDGRRVRLTVATATGAVKHETTWRRLVAGADALVFLADSRSERALENAAALRALRRVMELEGVDETVLPVVVAFNRRTDGPLLPDAELRRVLDLAATPAFDVGADDGHGVLAAFTAVVRGVFESLGRGLGEAAAKSLGALK